MAELSNMELKLVEKLREMMEKKAFRAGDSMTRTFTLPSDEDSDDRIHISLGVRCDSLVPTSSSVDVKKSSDVLSKAGLTVKDHEDLSSAAVC